MHKIYTAPPKGLTHAVFDIDQTLYPRSTNFQAEELDTRLEQLLYKIFIEHRGHISPTAFDAIYTSYWQNHGSSAVGLSIDLDINAEDVFKAYFKPGIIQYNRLKHCQETYEGLLELKNSGMRLSLFTNSTDLHGYEVVSAMGLDGIFGHIFGINHMRFTPKPKPEAFEILLWELNTKAKNIIFFEDSLSNLKASRQMGFGYNVYIGEREESIPENSENIFDLWAQTLPEALEIINGA